MGDKDANNSAAAAAELLELTSADSQYGSLAGFSIDKKIGKGQFSVVYRARAVHDDRTVALKKVQIFEMMDSKARLDCMKEIQLLQVRFLPHMFFLVIFSISAFFVAIEPSKCDQVSCFLHRRQRIEYCFGAGRCG